MIDIVGHFGSRLSYATISNHLARALLNLTALGNLTNLDDKFVVSDLEDRRRGPRGKKALLLADAQDHLIEMLVAEYGRDNVAIFVCPNTNRLSEERVRACHNVGRVYTPSRWCRDTIDNHVHGPYRLFGTVADSAVCVMPLGVDEPFASSWVNRNVDGRDDEHIKLLHVTTDTFWAGRKGTEELIAAWELARRELGILRLATLTIHCLPHLYATVYQELGAHDLLDEVKLVKAPIRGSTPEELFDLFASHDMLVAPSRSEGFGVMPLSALVSGLPVLTTAGTGQDDYLIRHEPKLKGWLQVPTTGSAELTGEDGEAPVVRDDQLALSLVAGCRLWPELNRLVDGNKGLGEEWSWTRRSEAWAYDLIEWDS